MLKKIGIAALLALLCWALSAAAQDYRLTLSIVLDTSGDAQTETYLTVKKQSDIIRVDWVQMDAASQTPVEPDTAHIYYSRSPNGGDISKYTRINNILGTRVSGNRILMKRYIRFTPEDNNMGAGLYYCIIAFVKDGVTHYSNYFELKVASPSIPTLRDPKGLIGGIKEIDELTPVFSWNPVEGVPYYHVILSDEPLPFDSIMTGGALNINLSIVWQAITPNTRITYGVPDPSNTITAAPPPLSPGKEYSWLVFNNYGNHMAFSDGNTFDIPGTFRIKGTPLREPRIISADVSGGGDKVTFKWNNLDTAANSYLINLFTNTSPKDLGVSELNQLDTNANASMLVWETTVSRGGKGLRDTLSVELLNASGTLTGGHYVWRVYALDSRGAATTGGSSKGAFDYGEELRHTVAVTTIEMVGGQESRIGYVELRSEVVSGPMQAPLAFYTLADGYHERPFPEGTYRITAVKDGYNNQTVTFSVAGNESITPVKIYMRRPDAIIYGKAAGPDSAWVNLAKVTAVSEWGDTVTAMTNGSGNFTLNCREADWSVTIEKAGYKIPRVRTVPLRQWDNINIGTIYLERNPNTLSGVVRNRAGAPVIGAKVRVLREDVLIEELASTPQNGAYSFALASGTYTLTAEKPGFVMYSRSIDLTGSRNQDITIAENAALINGVVFGRSWNAAWRDGEGRYELAPIPRARVTFISTPDTFTVTGDATFGKISLSVPAGRKFTVRSEAGGYVSKTLTEFIAENGKLFQDTLQALAMINGKVVEAVNGVERAIPDVDIIVYNALENRIEASAKSSNDGSFEIRNIPDGKNYVLNAGKSGYYLLKDVNFKEISVDDGRPEPSVYKLIMDEGTNKITWKISGYDGKGSVKVTSPLNKTIPFSNHLAVLDSVGDGDYIIEAAAESNPGLLQLSYHKFKLSSESDTQEVRFPLRHTPKDTITLNSSGIDTLELGVFGELPPSSSIKKVTLFHRSEGSTRYDSADAVSATYKVMLTPNRDGCDLQYYFRVELSNDNGDVYVYGSPKQVFTSHVRPNTQTISRIDVDPGSSGDTLYLPSNHTVSFAFKAFYSDLFMPFDDKVNYGSVAWSVTGSGARVSGSGRAATLTTGAQESGNLTLSAVLTPSSGYKFKNGKSKDIVAIPITVTGSPLKSLIVARNGGSGPVFNTGNTSFRVEASDASGKSVTVSPSWSVTPETAGKMSGNVLFEPKQDFFGIARVHVEAGGMRAEYVEAGTDSTLPGLSVNYLLRSKNAPDTASTHRGLRLAFPKNSIPAGESAELSAAIHSTSGDLKNSVYRGSGGFRMADSLSYDIEFSRVNIVEGNVSVIIDVPAHLRQDAASSPENFKVARWHTDSLKWITLPSSEVVLGGAAVAAKLSKDANDNNINAKLSKKTKALRKNGAAKTDEEYAAASQLHVLARYAVVVKSSRLSVDLTVSPNPFSPYIRPVKEYYYGKNYGYKSREDVPAGTCIRVNVEASEPFVRSLKVHVYNATGKRVWAVDKFNADVGENQIWWDGRTTSREEMWNEKFLEQNRDRGRMCRNGRYFVTVIVTDMEGRQQRVMKPLVLMK